MNANELIVWHLQVPYVAHPISSTKHHRSNYVMYAMNNISEMKNAIVVQVFLHYFNTHHSPRVVIGFLHPSCAAPQLERLVSCIEVD